MVVGGLIWYCILLVMVFVLYDSSTDEGATGPSSGPESEREHLSQETRGPNQV